MLHRRRAGAHEPARTVAARALARHRDAREAPTFRTLAPPAPGLLLESTAATSGAIVMPLVAEGFRKFGTVAPAGRDEGVVLTSGASTDEIEPIEMFDADLQQSDRDQDLVGWSSSGLDVDNVRHAKRQVQEVCSACSNGP